MDNSIIDLGYVHCDIETIDVPEYPITDAQLDKFFALGFHRFVCTFVSFDKYPGLDHYIPMKNIFKDHLNDEQKIKVQDYISKNISIITNDYFGEVQVKSARSGQKNLVQDSR